MVNGYPSKGVRRQKLEVKTSLIKDKHRLSDSQVIEKRVI
jgi:hypothetical protein